MSTPKINGYAPIKSPSTRQVMWHFFRSADSLCGAWEWKALRPEQVEATAHPKLERRYCAACNRIMRSEAQRGLPAEPAISDAEYEVITALWPTHTAKEIAARLGRADHRKISFWAKRYAGAKTVPNQGQFKKGQQPLTARPEQQEFLRHDKRGVPYYHVRGGKFHYEYKHLWLWRQANGPIPTGHVVVFKNHDTLDCRLDNLELITNAEHLGRNSGRIELTDQYVARRLSQVGRGQVDRDLAQAVLAVPELLEVKRNQLRLKRLIKQA